MLSNTVPNIGPMPALGLGTWKLTGNSCEHALAWALELGYRHIDTADAYENHKEVGKQIKSVSRQEIFLVTKIVGEDLREENVEAACLRFLNELDTPYIDLLLIHWPDSKLSMEKTLAKMVTLQEKKYVRHIGVSNFTIQHLESLKKHQFPILTNQVELHPYLQQKDLVDYCSKNNIIITAYRPIEKGNVSRDKILIEIGEKYGKTPVQVTLRWLLQKNIVAIPKASSKEHLEENFSVFDFRLSDNDMDHIAQLDQGERYVNPNWAEFD